jgi:hypothetical protein
MKQTFSVRIIFKKKKKKEDSIQNFNMLIQFICNIIQVEQQISQKQINK